MIRGQIVFCLLSLVLLAGPAAAPAGSPPQAAVPLPQRPRQRMARGVVVSVDAKAHKLVVRLDGIPGYMSPMTMSYSVGPREDLQKLSPGDRIEANVVGDDRNSHLESINVIARAESKDIPK